jgi:polo-like kinase 4
LQDYTIIAQIGKGAFGTVFEAQIAGRRVAIKALDKSTIRQGSLALRVRNEVAIHYQLRHRNVLELLHFFEDAEHVFMVMELAAGGELYQRIRRGPKLKDSEIRRIFGTIVEGVSYLHSHGIIHRDLKLSNILLSRDLSPVSVG